MANKIQFMRGALALGLLDPYGVNDGGGEAGSPSGDLTDAQIVYSADQWTKKLCDLRDYQYTILSGSLPTSTTGIIAHQLAPAAFGIWSTFGVDRAAPHNGGGLGGQGGNFPDATLIDRLMDRGITPAIYMECDSPVAPGDITNGVHDSYLDAWAAAALAYKARVKALVDKTSPTFDPKNLKNWRRSSRIIFRLNQEVNIGFGDWGSWTTTQYIDTWRYIHDRIRRRGRATNVMFFFCPWGPSSAVDWYPGDAYCQFIGYDAYNLERKVATTTLTAAMSDTQTSATVASASGFPATRRYLIRIDSEVIRVDSGQGTTTWALVRGQKGTAKAAHASGTTVSMYTGLPEWPYEWGDLVKNMQNLISKLPQNGADKQTPGQAPFTKRKVIIGEAGILGRGWWQGDPDEAARKFSLVSDGLVQLRTGRKFPGTRPLKGVMYYDIGNWRMDDLLAGGRAGWASKAVNDIFQGRYHQGDTVDSQQASYLDSLPDDDDAEITSNDTGGMDIEVATYQQGTFTPTLQFGTVGNLAVGYGIRVGRYTRIGNQVFYTMIITTTSFTHTTASGAFLVSGLPFTAANVANDYSSCAITMDGWTLSGYTGLVAIPEPNTLYLQVQAYGSTKTRANLTTAHVLSGGTPSLIATGHYEV